jgi:hypothetical protein
MSQHSLTLQRVVAMATLVVFCCILSCAEASAQQAASPRRFRIFVDQSGEDRVGQRVALNYARPFDARLAINLPIPARGISGWCS